MDDPDAIVRISEVEKNEAQARGAASFVDRNTKNRNVAIGRTTWQPL
jgi:hypothetical protein